MSGQFPFLKSSTTSENNPPTYSGPLKKTNFPFDKLFNDIFLYDVNDKKITGLLSMSRERQIF